MIDDETFYREWVLIAGAFYSNSKRFLHPLDIKRIVFSFANISQAPEPKTPEHYGTIFEEAVSRGLASKTYDGKYFDFGNMPPNLSAVRGDK
jgi:hypothetical protein